MKSVDTLFQSEILYVHLFENDICYTLKIETHRVF